MKAILGNQNYKKAILLTALVFLAASCNRAAVYREPNSEEVNSFIPFGYKLTSDREDLPGQIVKANLDSDSDKEIVLPLAASDDESAVKILVVKFNYKKNQWELWKTLEYKDFVNINAIGLPTDFDKNGIEEVHLHLDPYSATGGVNGHSVKVLTTKSGDLVDLMPDNSHFIYSQDENTYKTASFIWKDSETHFGCHFFEAETYKFNDSKFELVSKRTTKQKYHNDGGDSNCVEFNIHADQP